MARLKLLDAYLLRELAAPFLIGLFAFITVLCLNMAYFVLNLIVEKEVSLGEIVRIIALRMPFYLVLATPVAVLVASSLALNRLTRDHELTALRGAGVSLWRLLVPFAVFGALLTVISFAVEEYVSPIANHRSDNMYRRLLLESNIPTLTPDTFYTLGDRTFYFHRAFRVGKGTLELQQVMMYQNGPSSFPEIWVAREALVQNDTWLLKGVVVHHLDDQGRAKIDAVPRGDVVLPLHQDMSLFLQQQKLPEEMTARELKKDIQHFTSAGVRGIFIAQKEYEYYSKFALPLACVICALIGVPLNIRYARYGGFVGLFLALVSIFLYYNCMLVARSLAYSGAIPALVGAWAPNVIFAVICFIFIYREL